MRPIVDPRDGDVEDDASSMKAHSLLAHAGSMLVEISWMKLFGAWLLLIVGPSLALGAAPILAMAWANSISSRITTPLISLGSILALLVVGAIGWFGWRTLFRLAENSFWALNAVVIEPTYAVVREGLRHLGDFLLPREATQAQHGKVRAAMAAAAGVIVFGLAVAVAVFAWRRSWWAATFADLYSIRRAAPAAVANSVVLIAGYLAAAALFWGVADATLPQPLDLGTFRPPKPGGRRWRVAHLSDLHTVGEPYGFRLETGRAGPRGNEQLEEVLSTLEAIHARDPLDAVVISGDLTDAGRSGEYALFVDALDRHPTIAQLVLTVPGNHDLNVADRGNPARVDLPTSPNRRLRQVRTLSVASAVHGSRVHVVDRDRRAIGTRLTDALRPHAERIARFADVGRPRLARWWPEIWSQAYPMVVPPSTADGLGVILLNSNADTHFSFTNALGMVSAEQMEGIEIALAEYPQAGWVIVLHHHLVEYPWRAHAFSERIGTALINGNWFVRRLLPLADRAIVMHGHRHVDWLGTCAKLTIVSGPSPVMDPPPSCFYVHTIARDEDGRLGLLQPERYAIGEPARAGTVTETRLHHDTTPHPSAETVRP